MEQVKFLKSGIWFQCIKQRYIFYTPGMLWTYLSSYRVSLHVWAASFDLEVTFIHPSQT